MFIHGCDHEFSQVIQTNHAKGLILTQMIQIPKSHNKIIIDYIYSFNIIQTKYKLKSKHQYIHSKAIICLKSCGDVLQTRHISVLMNHMTMRPLEVSLGNLRISESKKQKIKKFKYRSKSLYGLPKAQKSSLKFLDNNMLKTFRNLYVFYFYFYHLASTGNKLKESKTGPQGDKSIFFILPFWTSRVGKKRSLKVDPRGRGHVDTIIPNQNLNSNTPR